MKMTLDKVNEGNHSNEITYTEMAKKFDNCYLTFDNECITITKNGKIIFQSAITLYEEDGLTTTYKGIWQDGKSFRLVRPGKEIRQLLQIMGNETITFGSMLSDGYAVTYIVK